MSSLPPKAKGSANEGIQVHMFTQEGLPLDHTHFGVTTTDVGAGGPARRIDCRSPQLVSAPSISPSKRPLSEAPWASSLTVGPCEGSLIDDNDDEIVDYFAVSGSRSSAPLTSTSPAHDGTSSSSQWNVREHNVPTLPSFYPLEKSAVFVPQASAPMMASRITSVLQARSIVASYDTQNAKVDCVSKSHVEFRVRLYRGRGEYSYGLIVEVQRRSGFDLSYTQDMYAILDAAEGKTPEDLGDEITPIYWYKETEGSCCSDEEDMDALENTAGLTSLRVISDILCPQGNSSGASVEGRDFALASLASLTSLDRMGQVAVSLSNELLNSEAHACLRQAVFSYVSRSAPSQSQEPQRPMLQSLEILANVATLSPSSSRKVLGQNDHELLLKLIVNIENAQLNPRVADLSCVILNSLCKSQVREEDIMLTAEYRQRLLPALMKSGSIGRECYADLKRQSQQFLKCII